MIEKILLKNLYLLLIIAFPFLIYGQEGLKIHYEYEQNNIQLHEKVKKELGRVSYLGMEVFVFFDNSLKGETITMTNHFIVPEISINLDENLENGFSKVYGLQGNSKNWYVNINGHILYIDSWTYLKYKFIVVKKLDQKEYKILFTNHPDYNFSKVDFEEIVEIPK
jgi:hypothetical protein